MDIMERMNGTLPGVGLVTALMAVGVVKLVLQYQDHKREREKYRRLIPQVRFTDGNVTWIEEFGNYVVRLMDLDENSLGAKRLAKMAGDYVRGDTSLFEESMENLFGLLNRVCPSMSDDEIEDLNSKFVKELDLCILSYFSFHWNHTAKVIDQVVNGGSMKKRKSLKMAVLTATRNQRFQRVMKELKTQRIFSNILEMMKVMGKHNRTTPVEGTVVVPADSSVRSPVLLLIGGGMGAGKSTVVKEIMEGPFWKSVSRDAVVVEADAFKESDVIYRALSSMDQGQNISEAADLVHESSTNAASSLLVTALNEGRDVILDGTMSWEPFVLQTIAMARDIHNKHYRMGPGYRKNEDGSILEQYWEPVEDWEADVHLKAKPLADRRPYRIEIVGVLCEAHMAVVRGMRRAIVTKRGVPVRGQLRSHKLFAQSIEKYCEFSDLVKIYSTSKMGGAAELIGLKDGNHKLLKDCDEFGLLKDLKNLNVEATSALDIYSNSCACNQKWEDIVLAPKRLENQQLLSRTFKGAQLHQELSEWDSNSLAPSPIGSPSSSNASLSRLGSSKSMSSPDTSSESDDSIQLNTIVLPRDGRL